MRTLVVTTVATLLSVIVAFIVFNRFSNGLSDIGLAVSIFVPVVIGAPMSFFHSLRRAQLRSANEQLQILASTDWLTNCLNRRAFTDLVNSELQTNGAFLVVDADNFKQINDRYGHYRGDEVLKVLAATIKANVREDDVVGRIGGEEFGVFLRGSDDPTSNAIAERIRSAVEAVRFAPDGEDIRISVSVGGATFDGGVNFTSLFRVADQRLYEAKRTGRNRTHVAPMTGTSGPLSPALAG